MTAAALAQETPQAGKAKAFPAAVQLYVAFVLAAALGSAALAATLYGRPDRIPWAMVLTLLPVLTISAAMKLRFQLRDQIQGVDLFEAMLAPAIFAFPPLAVVALVAVAHTIVEIHRRNHPIKATFNVSQWVLSAALATIVFNQLRPGPSFSGGTALALVAALTVWAVTNTLAFGGVITLAETQHFGKTIRAILPAQFVSWAINTSFGLLFVTSYRSNPLIVILFVVPLLVLRWSHRSYAAVLADKARLTGMHRATRALVGPINPRDAMPAFIDEVRSCFAAESAELVVIEKGLRTIYRSDEIGNSAEVQTEDEETLASLIAARARTTRVTRSTGAPHLVALLEASGHRDCIAAPMLVGGRVAGVLCVYDCSGPEGFEEGELSVIESLAREVGGAIAKAALLEEILEERRKLAEIVEHTEDGIVTMSPDGTIQMWNHGMETITGYPAPEMLGTRGLDRLRARNEAGVDVMVDRWAGGASVPQRLQIITSAGDTSWLACSSTAVSDGDDRPKLLIMVVRDITKAHEVERLKDDFVATVSHELRTPLTPIKGFAMTLVESGDVLSAADRTIAARSILNQAEHLERLVVNLLEASRLERGVDGRDHDQIVDVRMVAERVAGEFRSSHPERDIVLDSPTDLRARGDELFVGQIVSNLISNAIKYAPADQPIEIRLSTQDDRVVISVTDHGPGIPPTEIERIFDRFHRLGNVLTRAAGGTGLGLYIARQLAAAIGATLTAESTLGQGSTFTLRLRAPARLVAVS